LKRADRGSTGSQEKNNLRIQVSWALKEDWKDPKRRQNAGIELGPEVWSNQRDLAEQLEQLLMQVRQSIQKMILK